MSPSRIYKQLYHATAHKTELVAACLQLLNTNPSLSYDQVVQQLTHGIAMLTQEVDLEAEDLGFDAHAHAEVKQFSEHDLEGHEAFVVQQITPVLGRHAFKVCVHKSTWMHSTAVNTSQTVSRRQQQSGKGPGRPFCALQTLLL